MGGGMVFGEPYSYGFRYPYEVSGTPGYNSVFRPRRYPSFGGDESYSEEVTNLARKRKLDGIKGEAPGVSNENSVREIFVEDTSVSRISSAHESQAQGNASTSRGNNPTPPASPSTRGVSVSSGVDDGHTVTIPVVFSTDAAKEQSVPVVASEGIKKSRRTCSEEVAAVLIQSTYRGYAVRRTKPLEHMRRINSIKTKLEGIEQQLSDADIVQQIRTDFKIRVRITEGIMALLLQLDSFQGVHPDVRVWRKAVTKDVVTLQEKVDALLKDGEVLQVESVCVESSVQGHDKDIAIEGGNMAKDDSREHDEVMNDVTHEELLPESQNTSDHSAEDIVLDQLKLEDEEVLSKETAVVEKLCDNADHVDEFTTSVSGLISERRSNSTEATEEFGDAAISDGVVFEESDDGRQLTESSYHGEDGNEGADNVNNINAEQPINHDCERVTETTVEREGELRSEACLNCTMGVAENASDRRTGATAVEMNSNESPDVVVATTVAEGDQGMEVDSERTGPHNQGEVLGKSEKFHCNLKTNPREQEKMKVFLKEISSPEKMSPVDCCIRLNGAEEMDCLGAPGTCSDFEENDGDVASLGSHLRNGSENGDEGGATAGRTEQYEHDPLVLKLTEENKMLKSLLLEVMKWNQLQANSMKNVNDRLGKLEDKLMKEKIGRKPKVQRCTRSRVERRSRRYRE